ncbi:MAG: oligosaccharide flippase family protein [Planctomycetes bacterium]|nr:oligosaccharide flippase family protein [Planctomycetota bacterium]
MPERKPDALPGSAKDRLIRATSWHAAGRVGAGALGVLQAAYAFDALGEERYGLLTLVAVLVLLLALVEMGLRTTTTRFVAEAAVRGDAAAAREVLGSSTLIHLLAGAAVAVPFALLAGPVADLLGTGPALRGEAVALLRWMALFHVAGNLASGWTSTLVALQRTGPLALSMVAGGAAQLAGTVAAVRLGWGATALAAGFGAGTAVRAVLEAAGSGAALPGASVLPWHGTREGVRRLLATGRHLQLARVVDMVVFNLDQVLVTRFLGLGAGGVYRFASDLVLKVREAPLLLSTGIIPAATEVRDADGGGAIRRLYLRGTKYVAAAAAFLFAFLAAGAPRILAAAGGDAAGGGAAVMALLSAGVFFNVTAGVGTLVAVGLDRADLQARAALLTGGVSLLLVPAALLLGAGSAGAAAGTAAALLIGAVAYARSLHRVLGIPDGEALRSSFLPPLLPAAGVAAAAWLLGAGPLDGLLGGGRTGTALALALEGAVLGAAFAGALLLGGWADAFDRDVLRRALARGGAP